MLPSEELVFASAVREFWLTRQRQSASQRLRSISDQGARSEVTGGAQMDGFSRTITELLVRSGIDSSSIYTGGRKSQLPGFFRPAKIWDIVVVRENRLLAVIELKSHVGSYGNNFNNRTEEALGSALDLWTAYRQGVFGNQEAPWLGYLLLLDASPESARPLPIGPARFPVLPEFRNTSYAQRYELFCRKLVRERQYNAACFLLAARDTAELPINYLEPADDLSARVFLSGLLRHVGHWPVPPPV